MAITNYVQIKDKTELTEIPEDASAVWVLIQDMSGATLAQQMKKVSVETMIGSANDATARSAAAAAQATADAALVAADNLSDLDDASEARTNLGLAIGTDVQAYSAVLAATTASFTTSDETKLDGIEAAADVTDTANVTSAGALMDSEVASLSGIKTLVVPDSTTISTFGATLTDDTSASAARTTLGLVIGTDVASEAAVVTAQSTADDAATDAASAVSTANTANTNVNIVLKRAPYISATEHGVVGDGTASSGTDNSAAFTAAAAAAAAQVSATKNRSTLFIPSGNYLITTPIVFPGTVDVISDGVAQFYYNGTDKSQPVITIGTAGTLCSNGRYTGISISGVNGVTLSTTEANTYAGIRVVDMIRSKFDLGTIASVGVGLQVCPSGASGMYCGHNSFRGNLIYGCKWSIDLRTNSNTNWVNENNFYDFDCSGQGNLRWGSSVAVRFSTEPGGEALQNNNKFFGISSQPQLYSFVTSTEPDTDLPTSPSYSHAVVQGRWYVNNALSPPRQYYCTDTGTLSAIVNHTDGSEQVNGDAAMLDMGPYFRSPIFHDGAGLSNFFYACRHETGHGPMVMVKNGTEPAFGTKIKFAGRYEFYEEEAINVSNPLRRPSVDVTSQQPTDTGIHYFGFDLVGAEHREPDKFIIDDIADRAIGTATTLSIQGLHFNYYYDSVPTKDATGTPFTNWKILRHGVWYSHSNKLPSLFIESMSPSTSNVFTRFKVTKLTPIGSATGNIYVQCANSRGYRVNAASAALAGALLKTNCDSFVGYNEAAWYGTAALTTMQIAKGTNTSVAKYNVGMMQYEHVLSGLVISAYANSVNAELKVSSFFESSKRGQRSCPDTPTMGKFPTVGEIISNTTVTSGQPVYWVVKTAGFLNRAWPADTVVIVGEYCINDTGKAYCCTTAGTTASSGGPTGTSTGITDGTAVWEYVGVQAVLVSSIDVVSGGGDY